MIAGKSRILVVDDSKEYCQDLTDILEMRGHEVDTALNGLKALELLKTNDYEAVLMDIKVPQMDGVRALKNIRQLAPDTPVIMVTAHSDQIFNLAVQANKGTLVIMRSEDEHAGIRIKNILSQQGYLVDVISNAGIATVVQKPKLDVVILDLRLASLNTLDTYLTIQELRPSIVVVVIVGCQQALNELAQQAIERIVYAFLEKPVNIDVLATLLERIEHDKSKDCSTSYQERSAHMPGPATQSTTPHRNPGRRPERQTRTLVDSGNAASTHQISGQAGVPQPS